jgi:hypothetical protein
MGLRAPPQTVARTTRRGGCVNATTQLGILDAQPTGSRMIAAMTLSVLLTLMGWRTVLSPNNTRDLEMYDTR